MKSLKKIVMVLSVLFTTAFNAQIKHQKSETVKIYGNCEMCESTIEKAGKMKNQSFVDWNKDTNMAIISYDSQKTTKAEILKRIALAGYDSDLFLAPDDTYASLPSCCQYERAKKTTVKMEMPKMDMVTSNHSKESSIMPEMQEPNPLSSVYNSYFSLKDALVKTDGETASINAKNLLSAINEVKMNALSMDVHMVWMKLLKNLKENAGHIADTKEISIQRNFFQALSKNLYEVMSLSKHETPIYYQFCPMANDGKGAHWLSKEEIIKNPFYGSQMLSCGTTVETIKE